MQSQQKLSDFTVIRGGKPDKMTIGHKENMYRIIDTKKGKRLTVSQAETSKQT